MLTPVRAASNTSLSSNGQSVALASSGLGRSVVAPAPVQPVEAADLNSSIAGKLNIILAAARERMFEALLEAINAASDALPLPRQDGETNLIFASRLAEAIQKLPASRINEIETQLASQGHNLPLRLIAEALKNPAGPEAARVVTYLETLRYKDRDLAARAVMRSYRQNDASPLRPETRPNILLQEESLLPAAKPQQPAVAAAPQAPAQPKQDASPVAPATVARPTPPMKQLVEAIEAFFEEAPPVTDRTVEFSEFEVLKEEAAPAFDHQAMETPEVVEAHVQAIVQDDAEPAIPKVWTAVLASISEEAAELIVTIIGEQDMAAFPEDLLIEPQAAEAITDEVRARDVAAEKLPAVADMQAKPQQAEAARLPIAGAAEVVRQQKEIIPQPHLLPAEIAEAVQKSGLLKPADGLGYAQHPYQFAKDGAGQRDGEVHRRDYEGNEPEDDEQAHADAEQQNASDERSEQRPKGRVPQDLPEIEPSAPRNSVGDPVFALYQRMVGWE
jgi:hypothetical protein